MCQRTGSSAGITTLFSHHRSLLLILAAYSFLSACATVTHASPEVAPNAVEIGVSRIGDSLLRYVRFNTESEYPCLRFETIQPEQGWRVTQQRDLCGIRPGRAERISFRTDVAFVEFADITLEESGASFRVVYMPAVGQGEYQSLCRIGVDSTGSLGEAVCSDTSRL